jgi:hypothetical protein
MTTTTAEVPKPAAPVAQPRGRPILVHTTRADSVGRGLRHANRGDADYGLWALYDASGLELGFIRLGLCAGVVHCERPREIARVSDFGSGEDQDIFRFDAKGRRAGRRRSCEASGVVNGRRRRSLIAMG